jgi:hypothetical protein
MPNALDRYVAVRYFKYYALFILVLVLPMLPLLRSFALSYGYVLLLLSVAGAAAAFATLLEFGFRSELTTLQRYGVEYAQVFKPLLFSTVTPIVAVSALAVAVAVNHGTAVYWSVLSLCSATLCVTFACERSWSGRRGR